MGKRSRRKVNPREVDNLMLAVGKAELQRHGVWRTSFGAKFMPIVVVNPAYRRAMSAATAAGGASQCFCMPASSAGARAGAKAGAGAQRYFGSHAYNAGRHAATASEHKATCALWRPPHTGHLHSWRRPFADDGKCKS